MGTVAKTRSNLIRRTVQVLMAIGIAAGAWWIALHHFYPVYRDHAWRANTTKGLLLGREHMKAYEEHVSRSKAPYRPQDIARSGAIDGWLQHQRRDIRRQGMARLSTDEPRLVDHHRAAPLYRFANRKIGLAMRRHQGFQPESGNEMR